MAQGNGHNAVHERTMVAGGIFVRIAGLAVIIHEWLPSPVPSRPFWRISKASLQTSQSSKEAGKPGLR
jgi:hypothetical protein